ncbi:GNAT family N-acetyltransferase [Streptomyces phaeochromogenes]|uniref:GNAT family N-acetyltransferase n=1 Tax=Streptomyces phaeochromogenes TaxID=1923 RepID=UPI0033C6568F
MPQSCGSFLVKVADEAGELVGGLAAWTWGGLCGIELLWVREDSRKDGWGSRILQAAETEARRRGCDRVAVSSFHLPGSRLLPAPRLCRDRSDPGYPWRARGRAPVQVADRSDAVVPVVGVVVTAIR